MSVTINLRTIVAFVAGLGVALIAAFVFQPWRVDAAPGDTDSTLVPITPCRLIDTRPAPDRVGLTAAFGTGDTRTIAARGSNGNCTIPTDAVGLSLNVTALDATALTFLTFWPDGTRPAASSLNPAPGQPPTPNAVTTVLSATGSFNLYNLTGSVNVIIDVNGYYTNTSLQQLNQRLTTAEATIAVLDAAQPFTIASPTIGSATAFHLPTTIMQVTLSAPVNGQVAVIASGAVNSPVAGEIVGCGLSSGAAPNYGYWESAPGGGVWSMLSASRVFDIAAGQTAIYSLVCFNDQSGGSSLIYFPQLTAIFTAAP
jgi:hypothetical protein